MVLSAGLGVGGCEVASLVGGPEPRRIVLSPKSTFDEDLPVVDGTFRVDQVTASTGLSTFRIALFPSATELDYYANAVWEDVLPVMIQARLIESFQNTGLFDVLPREALGVRATYALTVHLREFQAEYNGNLSEPPVVHVHLLPRLLALPRRTTLARDSFDVKVEAAGTGIDPIKDAFDEAFGRAVKRMVEWTARTLGA
ncbi:MAG: ABC-type transport auxiliary lipoprotein family protein [Geminicoccaceae bacterium]